MLITRDGTLKITDYGFSAFVSDKKTRKTKLSSTRCGSPGYMAPEVVLAQEGRPYDAKLADMWSLGVVLFEILVGKPPFDPPAKDDDPAKLDDPAKDDDRFLADAKSKYWQKKHGYKTLSTGAKDLLGQLLDYDPKQRPSAEKVFKDHPWLADADVAINN